MNSAYLLAARRLLCAAPLVALLGGCMSSTPIWDTRFGNAERAVMHAQIIDPQAADHAPSAQAMDGQSAATAVGNYQKSFEQVQPTANAFVIGVGSGSSGK